MKHAAHLHITAQRQCCGGSPIVSRLVSLIESRVHVGKYLDISADF